MVDIIEDHRSQLAELCQRFGVRRLELFGSATTQQFDQARSDIDFIVDFDPEQSRDLFHQYFGLNEALEELLKRNVDLVMVGAMTNPYFVESVNRTRQLVYAA